MGGNNRPDSVAYVVSEAPGVDEETRDPTVECRIKRRSQMFVLVVGGEMRRCNRNVGVATTTLHGRSGRFTLYTTHAQCEGKDDSL